MNIYNEAVLANDLKIITSENPYIPVTTVALFIRAGSRYEDAGEHGYAHLLEHVLWRKTLKRPNGVDFELQHAGAVSNAHTHREYVCFFIRAAHHAVEQSFDILSDMICNPLFEQAIIEKEKKVILQELHSFHDNAQKFFTINVVKTFFAGHALAEPPIGEEKSIADAAREKIKNYHKRFYTPQRSALVISGKLSCKEAIVLAKKYFGKWGKGDARIAPLFSAFKTKAKKDRLFIKRALKKTLFSFNYHTVSAQERRITNALDCVAAFLTGSQHSFLYRKMRKESGLVYEISSNVISFTDAGAFEIRSSSTKPDEAIALLSQSLGVIPKELKKDSFIKLKEQMKNRFLHKLAFQPDEVEWLGRNFILFDALITPEMYFSQIDQLQYEDIISAAKIFLVPKNSLLAVMGTQDVIL